MREAGHEACGEPCDHGEEDQGDQYGEEPPPGPSARAAAAAPVCHGRDCSRSGPPSFVRALRGVKYRYLGDIHRDRDASASGRAALVLVGEAGSSPATVVANAHLMLGCADGATEQIAPVLGLPGEYRLSTLVEHMTTVDTLLQQERLDGSADVACVRTLPSSRTARQRQQPDQEDA